MSKRKRDDFEGANGSTSRRDGSHNDGMDSFRATLVHAQRNLLSALKLARGFERQKMGRRQKQASKQPKILLRLREEVIVLKQLDLEKTATNYLIRHLSKAKRVRESRAFQRLYGSEPQVETTKQGAEANVIGRLANSEPVKKAMSETMASVYQVLGLKNDSPQTRPSTATKSNTLPGTRPAESEESFDGFSEPNSDYQAGNDDSTGSEIEDDPVQAYQHRLADSDNESAESVSLNSQSISRSPSPVRPPSRKLDVQTSFLPTLHMGGYYSGSDSGDGNEKDIDDTKNRKNRRGQQARRRIAELKHGNSARHLQGQGSGGNSNTGWDPRRGAVDQRGTREQHQSRRQVGGRVSSTGSTAGDNGDAENKRRPIKQLRDDAGPLHPSWEAAKQRKSQAETQASFSGKKITFE